MGLNAIIVGGSSGMGKGAAKAVVKDGGKVLIASRSEEKLSKAKLEILRDSGVDDDTRVETKSLDFTKEQEVKAFFEAVAPGEYQGLLISACGRACHGSFLDLETEKVRELFDQKYWGPHHCAKYGALKLAEDKASIVFFSGVLCRRPGINCSPLSAVNGAVEGLTRALALELGPRIRVNCISPGFVDTERFDHMPPEKKQAMLESTAASLPLKRVGEHDDIGHAAYYLLSNPFTTGVVLDVDGGHQIRQYAAVSNDPFRKKE